MHAVSFHTFLQFVKKGSFNADNLPADSYSHTTAILLAFVPDPRLGHNEHMGIGNVIWRCRSPLGGIDSVHMVIDHIRVVLASEHDKASPKHQAYMMLIGNYGRHMAFATDPPYCVVCRGIQKHRRSFQNDTLWSLKPQLCHDSQQHGGEKAIVCAQLGTSGKEIDCRRAPSHPKGHAFWSQVVSGPSHTAQTTRLPWLIQSHGRRFHFRLWDLSEP